MLRWVVVSSLKHRRAIVAIALVVMAAGMWQLRHAKVDALPEFSPPTVEVQTEALGLSAQEVEQLVTVPLEQRFLNGIPFLDTISSQSVPGLSSVELIFKSGTNLFTARQLVQERLSLTSELPNVSKPPEMLQAESSTSRVMMIGLSTGQLSPIQLSVLAKYTIRPRLLGVPGVADVAIWGQRDLQLQVQVDPRQLQAMGVTLDQVITTTGDALFVSPLTFLQASTPGSGGFVDTANQRLGVQHILPIQTSQDLGKVSVDGTAPVRRLADVATVVEEHQPLIGDAALKDGPGLLLVVEKLPGANTLDVTDRVNAALNSLRPGLSGVNVDPSIYRPATFIDTAVHNLRAATVVSAAVLVVAFALLFFEWRAALVSLVTVPLSVITAAYILFLRGTTIDAFVLAGIVLAAAVVVHDGVAVTAAVSRRLRAGGDDPAPLAVAEAVRDVGRPLTYATMIAGLALVPLLFLAGVPSKQFLPPIALSYALAVAASLLVALTVTPALGALLLATPNGRIERSGPRPIGSLRRGYKAILGKIVPRPAGGASFAIVVVVVVVAVAGVVSLTQLTSSLRPSFRETNLVVQWNGPPGTSVAEMDRVLGRAAAELRSLKGVKDVGAHVGRALSADQVVGANSGELWVDLNPKGDRDATVASVQSVVAGYPGFERHVFTYFNDRVNAVQSASDQAVMVRLFGEDFTVLRAKADEIKKMISGVRGVAGAQVETQFEQPTIQVQVNLDAAQRHGIKPGDVRRAATTLVSGIEVGSLYQDQKVFQVVVVGTPSVRQNLTTVQDLVIDTPEGSHVRLGDVAQVQIGPSLSVIKHNDVSRSLDVTVRVQGRSAGAVAADVQRRMKGVTFPLQYSAKVLGGHSPSGAAGRRVAGAAAFAALIMFLLLQAAFDSWTLAALAFALVPLSLAGGALAAWADGGVISLGS
ncbi:MAG TPA: efflux RND transporter permease subunit, partial [Acidimicrobiales bacterium]|nr:efflux RND transporter permease subunit [Acidimicrobiales bacterium]